LSKIGLQGRCDTGYGPWRRPHSAGRLGIYAATTGGGPTFTRRFEAAASALGAIFLVAPLVFGSAMFVASSI
jgi:hypothetical protein